MKIDYWKYIEFGLVVCLCVVFDVIFHKNPLYPFMGWVIAKLQILERK